MVGYEPSFDMTRLPERYNAAKNSADGAAAVPFPRMTSTSRPAPRAPRSCNSVLGLPAAAARMAALI
jgi:hypothetical protein